MNFLKRLLGHKYVSVAIAIGLFAMIIAIIIGLSDFVAKQAMKDVPPTFTAARG